MKQMYSNDKLLVQKSLNFFGNSTFIEDEVMGFDVAQELVALGILKGLQSLLLGDDVNAKVKSIWICNNLISCDFQNRKQRLITKFFRISNLPQLILNQLTTKESLSIQRECLWFLTNLLCASSLRIEELQTFLND